ncbi:MAG: DNA internalization-related competence protein ComEC/Rec2 [Lachnospiraceae bacterium]|nr:DNA internalization-related competence protein ComEC/Rec2 [Lachnospiraceae bacterium]
MLIIAIVISIFAGNISITELSEKYLYYENIRDEICIKGKVWELVITESQYKVDVISEGYHYYVYIDKKDIKSVLKNNEYTEIYRGISNDEWTDSVKEYIQPGNLIEVTGNIIDMNTGRNPGNYDEKEYLHSIKVVAKIKAKEFKIIENSKNGLKIYLSQLQEKLCNSIDKLTDEKTSGVLKAMLFGSREDIDSDIKESYKKAGILHIISISGLHIGALGAVLFRILKKRFSHYTSTIVSGTVMVMFGILTGGSVSAVRAVIMFIISLGARICGRKYDLKSSISLTAIIMLIDNPYYIHNTSFKLSVMAIVAIAFVYEEFYEFVSVKISNSKINKSKVNDCNREMFYKLRDKAISAFLVSISVSLVTAPVIASAYFEISLYSVFVNLLVIPLMSIVLISGLIAVFVSIIAVKWGIFFIGLDTAILDLYNFLCKLVEKLPFNRICLKQMDNKTMCIYYGVLILIVIFMYIVNCINRGEINKKYDNRTCIISKVSPFLISAGIFILSLLLLKKDMTFITFIDVGQGDCTFINVEGKRILIDGGSSDVSSVGKYRISPVIRAYGYDTIDIVFISHTDNDHISGIKEIIREELLDIKLVVLPDITDEDSYDEFVDFLSINSVPCTKLTAGNSIKIGEADISVLSPTEDMAGDINDKSLVLLLEYNRIRCLFTGDISKVTEQNLVKKCDNILEDTDVLKVAHHGSKNSSGDEFLKSVNPKIAVISCGINNIYNHPHKEVLSRLENGKTEIYNTSEHGAVFIVINEKNLLTETFL